MARSIPQSALPFRIPHGAMFARPYQDYGIKSAWYDLGDGGLSETTEVTYKERYSTKTLAKVLAQRVPQQVQQSIDLDLDQEGPIAKLIRNMSKRNTRAQAAEAAVAVPANDGVDLNQALPLGRCGVYAETLTEKVGAAAATPIVADVDYFLERTSGILIPLRTLGVIGGTFSCIKFDQDEYLLASESEIKLQLMVIPIFEDGSEGEEIFYPLVGFAKDGAIQTLDKGDGDYSVKGKGTVYADPLTPSSPSGRSRTLPSLEAVMAAAAANAGDGDD